jgi:hypothetical protein
MKMNLTTRKETEEKSYHKEGIGGLHESLLLVLSLLQLCWWV